MPLVTSKEMLQAAREGHYAVGAFNANNMEQVQGIVDAAVEEHAPVILQVSQGAIRYAGLGFASAMVRIAAEEADVPVVLHLDHGSDFDQNIRCLRAGVHVIDVRRFQGAVRREQLPPPPESVTSPMFVAFPLRPSWARCCRAPTA